MSSAPAVTCRTTRRLVSSATHGVQAGGRRSHRTSSVATVPRSRSGEHGSVTAETAVAFPALVVVMAVALWGVSAAAAQVACVDAARAGARAAARGEQTAAVRAAVLRAAPPGASVDLTRDPLTTRVIVHAVARPPLKALFPALRLRAQAVAATEPAGGTSPARSTGMPHGRTR
jgi:hypothetical protein